MSLANTQERTIERSLRDLPTTTVSATATAGAGWMAYVELLKLRLNSLVLVATAVGFAMAFATSYGGAGAMMTLVHTLIGVTLGAGAGAVLNQWIERRLDSRMRRTEDRPIPSGRVSAKSALVFGASLATLGVVYLTVFVNPLAALLTFLTVVIYTLAYTPMKRVSSICTLIGAIPGAMPPLIGWAAARGSLDAGAWALFLIMYVWQMPHFLAIAWMYRDDYRRAGMPMLPVVDPSGRRTSAAMMSWSALLLPVSLAPVVLGQCGLIYATIALMLGVAQFAFVMPVLVKGTVEAARSLFLFSIIYLPILLGSLVVDAMLLPRLLAGG